MQKLYLDDLYIGQTFTSDDYALSQEKIIQFAQEYDPQIFHTDPDLAEDTFFKGLAASGWQTVSITMRLLVNSLPIATGIIGLGAEVKWPKPTRATDILHVDTEIVDIIASKSKPNQAIIQLKCETKNQHNEVLQYLDTKILAFRRPS